MFVCGGEEKKRVVTSTEPTNKPTNKQKMNKLQRRAVLNADRHRFSVVTGGPGVGKTLTIREIVRAWQFVHPTDCNIFLLGPTGKSVQLLKRLEFPFIQTEENDGQITKSNVKCYTIDYLLTLKTLRQQTDVYIIIDEASMVTRFQLGRVIDAFDCNIEKLVLVGDVDQLPPVSHDLHSWTLFRSILALPDINKTVLTETYRFTKNTALERNIQSKTYLEQDNDSFKVIKLIGGGGAAVANEPMKQAVCALVKAAASSSSLPQFLCHENDVRVVFNECIHQTLKSKREPIVCTSNYYVGKQLKVANGEFGWLINNRRFFHNRYFDDSNLKYELSYVITIHKAQGDEFPNVCLLVTKPLSSDLLYTAVSRASIKCLILTASSSLEKRNPPAPEGEDDEDHHRSLFFTIRNQNQRQTET